MPELPDITLYVEHLRRRVVGETLSRIQILHPFVLRSVEPSLASLAGKRATGVSRLGKRVVLTLEGEVHVVIHLMIAGRLHWKAPGAKLGSKRTLLAAHFDHGVLTLTEAGSKRRASVHLALGGEGLAAHDPGGVDVFEASSSEFGAALQARNHTLKRALTDPRILDGIGNAYSDEILHAAKLSPIKWTSRLSAAEIEALHAACKSCLEASTARLREDCGERFPSKVTAFRADMAVHGKYGEPCPECGDPVQRIVYASRETNYCATCQTGGKLLADRSLSRLLAKDWPKSLEALEAFKDERRR